MPDQAGAGGRRRLPTAACAAGTVLAFLAISAASAQTVPHAAQPAHPAHPAHPAAEAWVQACPGQQLCFEHPRDWQLQAGQGIDSLFQVYRHSGWTLSLDFGRYPMAVPDFTPLRERTLTVDGRPARWLSDARRSVLQVPRVHDTALGALQLTMVLQAEAGQDSAAAEALAQCLFRSIRFLPLR